jgi:hypothetical protein
MADGEPAVGSAPIHGELRTLGVDVSERTVSRLLGRSPRPSSPNVDRPRLWSEPLAGRKTGQDEDEVTMPGNRSMGGGTVSTTTWALRWERPKWRRAAIAPHVR